METMYTISALKGIHFLLHLSLMLASWTVGMVLSPLANEGDNFGVAEQGDTRRVAPCGVYAHSRCEEKKPLSYLGCHCLESLFQQPNL